MSMKNWAEREVEIAKKIERGNTLKEDWDYGCACYESALKAYNSLMDDNHSGYSFCVTRQILINLMNSVPLTPIYGEDDEWDYGFSYEDCKVYQNKRSYSLFKLVYKDGSIKYHDTDRFICVNVDTKRHSHFKLVKDIAEEYVESISMPYIPPNKPYEIHWSAFSYDKNNGDFDTWKIYRIVTPENKSITVDRYFKDADCDSGFEEIDEDEYDFRLTTTLGFGM